MEKLINPTRKLKRRSDKRENRLSQLHVNKTKYQKIWGTAVGKDCINLDHSLAKWLGKRLIHLGTHTNCRPLCYDADDRAWNRDLTLNGGVLLLYADSGCDDIKTQTLKYRAAKKAMRFVAKHFGQLWD